MQRPPRRSSGLSRQNSRGSRASGGGGVDYDHEGRQLVQRIAEGTGRRAVVEAPYLPLNEIYSDPSSGGRVYVGNHKAARALDLLQANQIQNVVNCMDPTSPNWHEKSGAVNYFRFPVAHFWRDERTKTAAGTLQYFMPLFRWIDAAVARGEGVLVHCLAGAHRAGTTGVAYLMHTLSLPASAATSVAKRARPCIDPIADFPMLLRRLQEGRDQEHTDKRAERRASTISRSSSGGMSRSRTGSTGGSGVFGARALRRRSSGLWTG
eukprot:Hpha_TRINITY_DN15562_c1_g16::TRINITY_DN15562_c1_g16_i1::g.103860::m.103860